MPHLIILNTWPSASPSPASPAARSACRPHPHMAELRSESPGSPAHARPGPPASPRCPDSSAVSPSPYPGSPAGKPSVASIPAALRRSGWSVRATERCGPVLKGDIRLVMCAVLYKGKCSHSILPVCTSVMLAKHVYLFYRNYKCSSRKL